MPALINYQPTYQKVSNLYETIVSSRAESRSNLDLFNFSTNISISSFKEDMYYKDTAQYINEKAISSLKNISLLENNWDEDGAIAPSNQVISRTSGLILSLGRIGQEIYNVVPGFGGEVMIDIRNNQKSIEIIFYPTRSKYVTFDAANDEAHQGAFDDNTLSQLLSWLNEQEKAA